MLGRDGRRKRHANESKGPSVETAQSGRGMCEVFAEFVSVVFDDLAGLLELSWAKDTFCIECSPG